MSFSEHCYRLFQDQIETWHMTGDVDAPLVNKYREDTMDGILYRKNWIDTVQWHLEDIIRDPGIDPVDALALKRRIDKSNQDRTDLVERIDDVFYLKYKDIQTVPGARVNTETPAWAIDRLSILALKIYHMGVEAARTDADEAHRAKCRARLEILTQQLGDLSTAIDELLEDIEAGRKYMKLYRQVKMYNDPALNPVLYQNQKQ
ncbi:MAG TPA: DUF4254 domain-containing protein [Candidatus Coprenecus stercoravium]|uniref:DUF4254 domain-containing protein n=1 Tax=Candidatus Coprenecus stercoravium TaxID=2840735 RepID=A0A9D2KBC1_9BACT|nr:DUF4254 domain-containing protein [Candidatus Coprenecus stercoravium]